MVTIEQNTAREFLEHRVMSRIGHALEREPVANVSWTAMQKISREAVAALLESPDSMQMFVQVYISEHPEMLARFLSGKASRGWLRIDGVAKLLGFSAPYVRALLDNEPFFKGKVEFTTGGQRKVLREHVEEWMRIKDVMTPEERQALPDYERETPELGPTATPAAELDAKRKARAESRRLRKGAKSA